MGHGFMGDHRANRGSYAAWERERVCSELRSRLLGYDKEDQEKEKKVKGKYITIEKGEHGEVGRSKPMSYHEAMVRYREFYYELHQDVGPFGHSLEVKKI